MSSRDKYKGEKLFWTFVMKEWLLWTRSIVSVVGQISTVNCKMAKVSMHLEFLKTVKPWVISAAWYFFFCWDQLRSTEQHQQLKNYLILWVPYLLYTDVEFQFQEFKRFIWSRNSNVSNWKFKNCCWVALKKLSRCDWLSLTIEEWNWFNMASVLCSSIPIIVWLLQIRDARKHDIVNPTAGL